MRWTIIFVLLCACAPKPIIHIDSKPIDIPKVDHYSVEKELAVIPKPTPIVRKYLIEITSNEYRPSDEANATHVMLTPEEFAKVAALKELAVAYKKIALEQEKLINSYIDQYNAITQIYGLEVEKSNHFRSLYVDSENAFRQEEYEHKWDNGLNRTSIYAVSIGSILVLLFAL